MRLGGDGPELPAMRRRSHRARPIPGSARLDHLAENLGALDVRLSRGDLAELERVAPPGAAVGARTSPTGMELTAP